MLKYKPEEILNYIKSRLNKETKLKSEINIKNNNILKNISLYNTLNNLKINSPINNPKDINNNNIFANFLYINNNKKKENKDKENSKILVLKNILLNNNHFELFHHKNKIDIDNIKKYLNIKKKKYNKGIDFCSYFMQTKNNYYINTLNEGIINNYIAFYSKANQYYCNSDIKIGNEIIDIKEFKINKIKYPIFIVKNLKNKNNNLFGGDKIWNFNGKERKLNLYTKCVNIIKNENNLYENIDNSVNFIKGLNHTIRYDLDLYLNDKIKLLNLNNKESSLFENKKYLEKYNFQFIKNIDNNKEIIIDKKSIIPDKKLKHSFNEPRILFPLFLKRLFDKVNVYNQFSFYKNSNIVTKDEFNLIFEKNIDRQHDLNNNKFCPDIINLEESNNIFNGYYLINPFQLSINDREFVKKTSLSFYPKKLNKDLKSILGSKFNYNKYRFKRNYLNLIKSQSQKPKKDSDNKLILINKNFSDKFINNPSQYIIINYPDNNFDFLFDINICGKVFFASEFYVQFQYNGYNIVYDLIDKNYLYYNKFYLFIIDDEKLHKNMEYKTENIVKSINKIIEDKFNFLTNDKYNFNYYVKILDNPHLINYEINQLYEEFKANYYKNELSIYNENVFNRILNEVSNKNDLNKDDNAILINDNNKFNLYENYILNIIQNSELKEEIQRMIKKKYSKINII